MIMEFGKHKGEDILNVPITYLKWLETQPWINPKLRKELNFEIERREGNRPGAGKVVKEGK